MRVQLTGIQVSHQGKPVLRGLDLETGENEYVVILGNNGAGKTTILRTIAGLQAIDAGSIRFNGKTVTKLAPRQRSISMVFQDDALYPHLTVAESIQQVQPASMASAERIEEFDAILEKTQLHQLIDRYPDQLSGGERRRTAIARAMARGSEIRLLDEPMTSLDPALRPKSLDDIQDWHETTPGTTIHVTHDAEEAMQVADRIAILSHGEIVQFDSPEIIYQSPKHLDAATTIGSPLINLVSYKANHQESENLRLNLPESWPREKCEAVNHSIIGIRPQHWRIEYSSLSSGNTPESGLSLRATIKRVWTGCHELLATALWEKQTLRLAFPLDLMAKDERRASMQPGQKIQLYAEIDDLNFFAPDTGKRIHFAE